MNTRIYQKEHLSRCIEKAPGVALTALSYELDDSTMNWCARQDPRCGLETCDLDASTADYCIGMYPELGLENYADRYSSEQLDYCIENYVWTVLEHAFYYLSRDQINRCATVGAFDKINLNRYLRGKPEICFVYSMFKEWEHLGATTRKLLLNIVPKYI